MTQYPKRIMTASNLLPLQQRHNNKDACIDDIPQTRSVLDHRTPPRKPPTTVRALWFALGFFSCIIIMELSLEGATKEFPDLDSLPHAVTLFQFGSCFVLPVVLSKGKSLKTFPRTLRDTLPFALLGLVVFGSTFLASLSAMYVSYPTKVVFKSAKLVPTMIVATVLRDKNNNDTETTTKQQQSSSYYSAMDYCAACLLCAGAAGYGFGAGNNGITAANSRNSSFGITCLLISIFCDAFTPNIQQKLMRRRRYSPLEDSTAMQQHLPIKNDSKETATCVSTRNHLAAMFFPENISGLSVQELMTNANGVGCAMLVIWMTLSGSLFEVTQTALTSPLLLEYLCVIGGTLSLGVFCYTQLIHESGPVVAVAVATLRKVATVVLSYVVYPKRFTILHMWSGFFVLGGILLSNYSRKQTKR